MSGRNFANLNINPCKMCMPMGAVTAFKGIENSMVILHGSQGCSTYIRRHMSEHYNEPVDIASSSLSEEGTVYGGEKNLKSGLMNIMKLYNPSVIGVATTCLAETIGEDIERITQEFIQENGTDGCLIVPVHTPGYGGTQFEGYYSALRSMLEAVCHSSEPDGRVNIIAGYMSPADIRNLKRILASFGLAYTLLPDISDTLDSPYSVFYRKIPEGGTRLEDIRRMPGAKATIEVGLTVPDILSPGKYLQEQYNVPLHKCSLPMGLRNTGEFLELLSEISGIPVPQELLMEKGRLLDGMIDSHKYNGEGRAVIFGEPGLVAAITGICAENGIKPVLVSTGADSQALKAVIARECAGEMPILLNDTDFETILSTAAGLNANILIGNSDGKVITEKLGIPLVRAGYPIHDRVGGQRLVYTGYNGTMNLLDEITNTLIAYKNDHYRQRAFEKYYGGAGAQSSCSASEAAHVSTASGQRVDGEEITGGLGTTQPEHTHAIFSREELAQKTLAHPCYSGGACKNARMHIPVAPACNISCNYCNRKYDCANESRPGVTSEILAPREAAEKFLKVKKQLGNLKVVGIAGPGDALANFEATRKSIELIKQVDASVTFCLSTNGLMLPHYADEIIKLGVTHVTITINAVDPKIGALIYREANYMGKKVYGEEAAALLMENQLKGLSDLSSRGVVCKVNIVMIKGVNDGHVEEIVKKVKEHGAYIGNIMPLIPAKGSRFEKMAPTGNKELNEMRKCCEKHLKQMYHCRQCRADAIGMLDSDISSEFGKSTAAVPVAVASSKAAPQKDMIEPEKKDLPDSAIASEKEYILAVASTAGKLVDCHFGHARKFYIYRYGGGCDIELVEVRNTEKYCNGPEDCDEEESKHDKALRTLKGCDAVLVTRIGYHPMKAIEERGIKVIQTYGRIGECIRDAAAKLDRSGEQSLTAPEKQEMHA